jgi:Flp pilus assembly protein protease CpaA
MILTIENIPLIILAFIWIIGAILQDLKRREVDNIWNFSLIAFALAYRIAISINTQNYSFALNGILGFILFIIIGNILYYGRVFAGGDAKLLIGLGTILPLSYDWIINSKVFLVFIASFLLGGALYVLIWSIILTIIHFKNFKKEFSKQFKIYKKTHSAFILIILLSLIITLLLQIYYLIPIIVLFSFFPTLFLFAKSVEEACMIKVTPPNKVTEGDWLYKDIKVGNKTIKATWEGITKKQLKLIQTKYKKDILIKQGIPFTPGFLIGFIILLIITEKGLFEIF